MCISFVERMVPFYFLCEGLIPPSPGKVKKHVLQTPRWHYVLILTHLFSQKPGTHPGLGPSTGTQKTTVHSCPGEGDSLGHNDDIVFSKLRNGNRVQLSSNRKKEKWNWKLFACLKLALLWELTLLRFQNAPSPLPQHHQPYAQAFTCHGNSKTRERPQLSLIRK